MSDASYYQNVADGENAMSIQSVVKRGWTLDFEAGERKFGWTSFKAKRGETLVKGSTLDEVIHQVNKIDFPQDY
jgi:hypothetical protein